MIFTEFEANILLYSIIIGGLGGLIRPIFIDNIRENTKSEHFIGGSFIGTITVMIFMGLLNGNINIEQQFLPFLLIGLAGSAGFWASNLVNFYQELIPILQETVQEQIINFLKKGKDDKTDK